jgi:hypothetical protein
MLRDLTTHSYILNKEAEVYISPQDSTLQRILLFLGNKHGYLLYNFQRKSKIANSRNWESNFAQQS